MSSRYAEYLANPIDILEPDRADQTLPQALKTVLPFIDSHIDIFVLTFKDKRGRTVEVLKEGFQIKSQAFWQIWNNLKTEHDLKYFSTTLSSENVWYLVSTIKRK